MAATIDTLRLARRFREAGVPEPQAELFADTFREQQEAGLAQLATKAELQAGLEALRLSIKADIEMLRLSTKADVDALRMSTKADLENLEQRLTTRIAEGQNGLLKRLVPLLVGQAALTAALVKLL